MTLTMTVLKVTLFLSLVKFAWAVDSNCLSEEPPVQSRALLQFGMTSHSVVAESQWMLGAHGQSCSDVCGTAGKFCHESTMYDVDTKEEMKAAAEKAGYNCTSVIGWGYDNLPGICTDAGCCGGSCVGLCAYGTTRTRTCTGSSPYARVCECFAQEESIPTTTPAPPPVAKPKPAGFERSLFLLPGDADAMLVLAAIPAAAKTAGEPAVLVMPKSGDDETASLDFVETYQPEHTYAVGSPALGSLEGKVGKMSSLPDAAPCKASAGIARQFWSAAPELVVVSCDDYASTLMAAPLAAKKGSPLILLSTDLDVSALATELKANAILYVGTATQTLVPGLPQTNLPSAADVFEALGKPQYLAVTNPADRERQTYQSMSALAPMLAALRGGAVLPLAGGDLTSSQAMEQVKSFVGNSLPKYMALVGGPDALPPHCQTGRLFSSEKCRDAPYADLDGDIFLDVALGRVVGRDLASGTLLVSRIANYEYVRDAESEGKFAISGHLKTAIANIRPALRNVGFEEPEKVGWPELKFLKKLHVSAFLHTDHSGAGGMGDSFDFQSKVLLSPMMVSSGGCSTAGLDELSDPMHSVVLTLLHYGAVGFLGGPRAAITASGLVHGALWNGVAEGKTIGEAFLEGWNDIAVNYEDQDKYVLAEYVMMNIALYGDPAFKLFVPGSPQEPLPKAVMSGDEVLVTGPQHWTKFQADDTVTDEWGWGGELYYYGAPGAIVQRQWKARYDHEWPYYYVRITTDKYVQDVRPITPAPTHLGYVGSGMWLRGEFSGSPGNKFHVDEHADGTRTVMWRVLLLDYSYETGAVKNQFVSQTYKITLSDSPPTTTTTTTGYDPVPACQAKCADDGYCCGRDSGCGRPSCTLGCEVAVESPNVSACQETCRSLSECWVKVGGKEANVCTSCKANVCPTCKGSCSGHCEEGGGCEHACTLITYGPTTATTTVYVANWEIAACRDRCTEAGYCCDRDSGCERPSCKLGCEIAADSSSKMTCKDRCKSVTGCYVDPFNTSLGNINVCADCGPQNGGTCKDPCEAAGGCEYACDVVSF